MQWVYKRRALTLHNGGIYDIDENLLHLFITLKYTRISCSLKAFYYYDISVPEKNIFAML